MRRLEVLSNMHIGPLRMDVKAGDVIDWDEKMQYLSVNSVQVEKGRGIDLAEAIDMLDRQRHKNAEYPWTKELPIMLGKTGLPLPSTQTQVMLPVLGCLKAAEEFLASMGIKIRDWCPQNEEQYQFLNRFGKYSEVVTMLGNTLRRKADKDVSVINDWLRENGFDIQLEPESGTSFAVASILDVLIKWADVGKKVRLYTKNGDYPAVKMNGEENDIRQFVNKEVHPYPVIRIKAESEGKPINVFMSVLDYVEDGLFGLTDKVNKLSGIVSSGVFEKVDGLTFPMVDYNQNTDISWIGGLTNIDWHVGQALQQTKFRMNERGARAQSAVAMTFRCMALAKKNYVVIDRPFVLWIEKEGVPLPLFTGVFCEDVWKEPKDIESV